MNIEIDEQARARFLKLKDSLKLAHYQAVGIIEILRVIAKPGTGRRLTPESLAEALERDGNVEQLYTALVECGYLQVVPQNN